MWLRTYGVHWSKSVICVVFVLVHQRLYGYSPRYSSEGRVTNITLPTGEVSGFHGNLERWSRVEVEASTRENFVTSTNLSASDTIYTFRQGMAPWQDVCSFITPRGSAGTLGKLCGRRRSLQRAEYRETHVMCPCSHWLTGRKDYSLTTMHLPASSLPQTCHKAAHYSSEGD